MSLISKIKSAVEYIQNKRGEPYFRYGDLMEVEGEVAALNAVLSGQHKKYPFVYMNTDFEHFYDSENKWYDGDLDLWIINRSIIPESAKDREANELPLLRTIKDSLKRAVEINVGHFDSDIPRELFFNKNETELDSPVNVIRLRLQGLKYC